MISAIEEGSEFFSRFFFRERSLMAGGTKWQTALGLIGAFSSEKMQVLRHRRPRSTIRPRVNESAGQVIVTTCTNNALHNAAFAPKTSVYVH